MVHEDQWEKFLHDCRENEAEVSDPTKCEAWKYLRPPNVGPFAAGQQQIEDDDKLRLEELADKTWLKDPKEGFLEADIVSRNSDGTLTVLAEDHERIVKAEELEEMNPACFNLCEDMSRLTHLNEASILHNLGQRYRLNLIHTYSGLFCITVNPWRQLPIYSGAAVSMFKGQNQSDMPPHVYSVADSAYGNMLQAQENQAILITGESGAGKTENTKKILQYFAVIAAPQRTSGDSSSKARTSLAQQILESNPVMETFGNAKTLHNDNSSRFGKFIRVKFDSKGKVASAEIDSYLLEKSRIIAQSEAERSYHIFYQLLSNGNPELKESLNLHGEPADYRFIAESAPRIEGVDDAKEMLQTERALSILGFSEDEKLQLYQMTAACLLMGQMKFAQRSSGDQAYPDGIEEAAAVCHLLGVNLHRFLDSLTEPTVSVGDETIKRGQNLEQVLFSVSAVAKAVYERAFRWLVTRCNRSISLRSGKADNSDLSIGVLDIAGFEIFTINSFEQLCINYTNEKLQQFFNHHMFIKEQEEYHREKIIWNYIDYGMDLQPTIDLIEKPMGIFSMLEEECIIPKGSDKNFAEKLLQQQKSKKFGRPKHKKCGLMGDFSIRHYAGIVNYNVEGWIDKNKDPMNECIIRLFQHAENSLFSSIWKKYVIVAGGNGKGGNRRRNSFSFLTVSLVYKDQLANLINTLNASRPHFIRCIVPNYDKKPGLMHGSLVLFQLRCNGVLEGIRICRQGYPNRMVFEEFKNRYRILDTANVDWYTEPKEATAAICKSVGLKAPEDFQIGKTKIFCRAGTFGKLEAQRTQRLSKILSGIQAHIRWYKALQNYCILQHKHDAIECIQRNVRQWTEISSWSWQKLWNKVKPLTAAPLEELKQEVNALKTEKVDLQEKLSTTAKDNLHLRKEVFRLEDKIENILETSRAQDYQLDLMKKEMNRHEGVVEKMHNTISTQQNDLDELRAITEKEQYNMKNLRCSNASLQLDVADLEHSLNKEKKLRENLEESHSRSTSQLRELQKQVQQLQQTRSELENTLIQKEDKTEYLTIRIEDQRKLIRKLQDEIKNQQNRIDELESQLHEEKAARRRADKAKYELEDDVSDLRNKIARLQRTYDQLNVQNHDKDTEITRLKKQLENDNEVKDAAMEDLRKRHAATSEQFQLQIEQLHKKALKLEGENQQLKAQQDSYANDPMRYRLQPRSPARRHSTQMESLQFQARLQDKMTRSFSRSSSSTSNILTRRLDELEREIKELQLDKRMKIREIDAYKFALAEEITAKEGFSRQVRNLLDEIECLTHQLMEEEEKKDDLTRQLSKAHSEVLMYKAKAEEQLIDRDTEFSDEKKRLVQKLSNNTEEMELLTSKLHVSERVIWELREEMKEKDVELERAWHTATTLEKLQKAQDKALDQWNSTYKDTSGEMVTLREENTRLRLELRQYKRELMHEMDDMSEAGTLPDSGRASVDDKPRQEIMDASMEIMDASLGSEKMAELEGEVSKLKLEKEALTEEINRLHRICHELNVQVDSGCDGSSKVSPESDDDDPCFSFASALQDEIPDTEMTVHLSLTEE